MLTGPSLRRQLSFWLLAPLLLLWGINAWMVYQTAVETSNRAHDRTLQGSLLAIAERISMDDKAVVVDLPYSALEMLESDTRSRVYYRVSHGDGSNITGYEDFPLPPSKPEIGKPFFYDAQYRGDKVRVAALLRPLYGDSVREVVLVQVGETTEMRQNLLHEILLQSVFKELLLIVFVAALMWFALNRGLRPLAQIRNQISRRERSDLSPIDAFAAPAEVRPLIDAVNEHMMRLTQMIAAQKHFIADAAHQLKTPLTLLRTQAKYASRQSDMAAVDEVLRDLCRNTEQVSHLVDQLLALNRAEAESVVELDRVDLHELARATTFDWLPLALKKSIDLGYEGDRPVTIMGHEFLLHELLKNLVDNAIRFTPGSGHVTVRTALRGDRAVLCVEDSGPGIEPHERERVFARFYQVPGSGSGGCGIGLAIVKEIVSLHHASISLQDSQEGTGTLVIVEFMAIPAA